MIKNTNGVNCDAIFGTSKNSAANRTLNGASQRKLNSSTSVGPKKFNGGKDKQPDFEDEKQFILCNQPKSRIWKA